MNLIKCFAKREPHVPAVPFSAALSCDHLPTGAFASSQVSAPTAVQAIGTQYFARQSSSNPKLCAAADANHPRHVSSPAPFAINIMLRAPEPDTCTLASATALLVDLLIQPTHVSSGDRRGPAIRRSIAYCVVRSKLFQSLRATRIGHTTMQIA